MRRVAARLGEILVKQGACSEDAVRDALKNQIIFGGRLGTNLLEIEAVTEEALARALGKQHGLPCLHGPQQLDPAAVALLTPEIADRYDAVPFLLQDRRLALLVVDPRNLAMLDEVAFATGKAVHPVVAPEARVWSLLKETYAVDRHLRGIDVEFGHMRGKVAGARAVPEAAPAQVQSVAGDLMDEGEFSALYESQPQGGPPRPAAPPPAAPGARAAPRESPASPAVAPRPPAAVPPAAPRAAPPPAAARPAAPPPGPRPAPPAAPPPGDIVELTNLLIEPEPWHVPAPARPVAPEESRRRCSRRCPGRRGTRPPPGSRRPGGPSRSRRRSPSRRRSGSSRA